MIPRVNAALCSDCGWRSSKFLAKWSRKPSLSLRQHLLDPSSSYLRQDLPHWKAPSPKSSSCSPPGSWGEEENEIRVSGQRLEKKRKWEQREKEAPWDYWVRTLGRQKIMCVQGSYLKFGTLFPRDQHFLTRGHFASRRPLAVSGDSSDCHIWGRGAPESYWVKARNVPKHPTVHRTAPTTKNFLASDC